MLEQVLAEDVRTALRRCAAERATRRGVRRQPGPSRGRAAGMRSGRRSVAGQLWAGEAQHLGLLQGVGQFGFGGSAQRDMGDAAVVEFDQRFADLGRSEEQTSELQSLMRILYTG